MASQAGLWYNLDIEMLCFGVGGTTRSVMDRSNLPMFDSVPFSEIICKKCGESKPLSRFKKNNHATCKDCMNAESKERYKQMKAFHELSNTYSSSEPQTKVCEQCGKTKDIGDFKRSANVLSGYLAICKPCSYDLEHTRIHEAKTLKTRNRPSALVPARPSVKVNRTKRLREYNLTIEEYEQMSLRQNGKCASCGNPETSVSKSGKVKLLAVDHNHVTGEVRGLLCGERNRALGLLRDDPKRVEGLLRYIRIYTA